MNSVSTEAQLKAKIQIIANYLNSGEYREVINKTIPLIKKFPNIYIFNNLLALAYNATGQYELAIKILEKALKLNSQNIFVLNNLGLIHGNLQDIEIAEKYLKKALSIKPSFLDASITLANIKTNLGQNEEAIIILEEARKLYKKNFKLNFSLGNVYQQKGDFKWALECFQTCQEIEPDNTAVDKSISLITKYHKDSVHLNKMRKKFSDVMPAENKMWLSFALGKALEDTQDYKNSFKYLKIANDIKNKKVNFDITREEILFKNIKKLFKVKNFPKIEPSNKKILFVLGMPRSGTTLVEQILSSHKDVYGAGELNHVHNFIEKKFLKDPFTFYENKVGNINVDEFVNFRKYYLEKIDSDKQIITDKAPLNFKWIGFLLMAFPNCKIVHLKRNPMDICWSMYKNYFASNRLNFCYEFSNLGSYYLIYKNLMSFWNTLFKDKIYNIEYENLIKNQKKEIKDLLSYCDLSWDENCMTFYNNKKFIATASLAQARTPIYNSSIEKWKHYSGELIELSNIINS